MLAAAKGHLDVVKVLVELKASPDKKGGFDGLALKKLFYCWFCWCFVESVPTFQNAPVTGISIHIKYKTYLKHCENKPTNGSKSIFQAVSGLQ